MTAPSPELRKLVDQALDGILTDKARLESLLRASPEAIAYYTEMTQQEQLLSEMVKPTSVVFARKPQQLITWNRWLIGVAAVIVLIFALSMGLRQLTPETNAPVAKYQHGQRQVAKGIRRCRHIE